DEASMIDIDLFARFMEALPEKNFRLFILGDPDQLPSVEAGAVLGEMLKTGDYAVKLNESHRFNMNSEIGKLSIAIQHTKDPNTSMCDHWPTDHTKPLFHTLQTPDFNQDKSDIINYTTLPDDKKSAENALEKLVKAWTDQFYIKPQFIDRARKTFVRTSNDITEIVDENGQPVSRETLDEFWKVTESARILSAERKGITGVQELNALVRKCLNIKTSEPFFVGQLLMLTENQSNLKLYNGDCGIVLGEKGSGRLHLMLKKARTQTSHNDNHTDHTIETDHTIDYVTYPLSVLPQKPWKAPLLSRFTNPKAPDTTIS
ncbi:MAG: AAA family ATPase, partial [Proteobacteria bacterium]|nr:AAA family ATPase [Pseudomonadota bacterium]